MDKLKEKLSRLMYGRYGIDQLGNFMMWAAVAKVLSHRDENDKSDKGEKQS